MGSDDVPFFQDPAFQQEVGELGITTMRLGTCALMVHHGLDKIQNVDGFSATMAFAVIFHLLNTGPEGFPLAVPKAHSYNFELAAMYVLVLSYFSVAGAGKYSVDEQFLGGELEFYGKTWQKVTGDAE